MFCFLILSISSSIAFAQSWRLTFWHLLLWRIQCAILWIITSVFSKHKCLSFHINRHDSKWFVNGSLLHFSFFDILLSVKDFIWAIAILLSCTSRSFCGKFCPISNALILSILLKTTNCSNVA